MLIDQTVAAFADELASNSPAPGGGSIAALAGTLGAALTSMVCRLTVGKKNTPMSKPNSNRSSRAPKSCAHRSPG